MAISEFVDVLEHQLFIQRDGRDPLGVWVARHPITGDASGGSIKVGFRVTTASAGGRIYTAYSLQIAGLTGAISASTMKTRLLTNFPDADIAAGISGFSTLLFTVVAPGIFEADGAMTAPGAGPAQDLVKPNDRFILLFGPQRSQTAVNIAELELAENIDLATYSFEAYGYFWDRQVLYVPGGPRHPGSD